MKKTLKQRFIKIAFILFGLFVLLYGFRLIYGYTLVIDNNSYQSSFFNDISSVKRNYASKEYKVKSSIANHSLTHVDQKYEKVAEVNTKSAKFKEEEK